MELRWKQRGGTARGERAYVRKVKRNLRIFSPSFTLDPNNVDVDEVRIGEERRAKESGGAGNRIAADHRRNAFFPSAADSERLSVGSTPRQCVWRPAASQAGRETVFAE